MSSFVDIFKNLSQFRGARVDWDEFVATVQAKLADIDQTQNGFLDRQGVPISAPKTPYENLVSTPGVTVSRDFRDLATWDRVRDYNPKIHGWPKNKKRGQSRGRVPWERLTTVVLHTAGTNGMHPDRWLGVPSHIAIANDATVVLQHYLNTYLWSAHAANRFSCSLEIAGNQTISKAQIPAARAAVRYMVEQRQLLDDGPMMIMPHRHSHKSRGNDCNDPIWTEVGVWAMDELGLGLGPVVGSGRPLPFKRK